MGGALPVHIRSLVLEQLTKTKCSLIAVCTEQGLSYSTIRRLWKRYKAEGVSGLKPHYERCGSSQPKSEALIYRCALWLKRHHPAWGAPLIWVVLHDHYPQTALPAERTLQRWFKAQHLYPPKGLITASHPDAATTVHDTWQIDAKEKLHLHSGQAASYLSIVDEHSGSLLKAVVFPLPAHQ
ncbi:MAG: helix-turn-helix domain-containing protein [Williamsia sp.]|nr:helix-turn-helix domain-containing protein [Williamsia sp.]